MPKKGYKSYQETQRRSFLEIIYEKIEGKTGGKKIKQGKALKLCIGLFLLVVIGSMIIRLIVPEVSVGGGSL